MKYCILHDQGALIIESFPPGTPVIIKIGVIREVKLMLWPNKHLENMYKIDYTCRYNEYLNMSLYIEELANMELYDGSTRLYN